MTTLVGAVSQRLPPPVQPGRRAPLQRRRTASTSTRHGAPTSSRSTTSTTRCAKIVLGRPGRSSSSTSSAAEGVLQTACTELRVERASDGNDAIFGDLGNDWLVGGTGRDQLFGGWGNDLMNVDDDHRHRPAALNDVARHACDLRGPRLRRRRPRRPDRQHRRRPADRLGRRVQQLPRAVRAVRPRHRQPPARSRGLAEFLYALSKSHGADPTRAADTGADPARNGEPDGELGLSASRTSPWQDQTGGPIDPQAGNVPGGQRDVLRSATFNRRHQPRGLRRRLRHLGGLEQRAPGRRHARSMATRPPSTTSPTTCRSTSRCRRRSARSSRSRGWKANAYIIFDYQDPTHFKFAGIDVSINKLVMGHRDASGWVVDEQTPFQAKPDTFYNMLLAVNGLTATLIVDNAAVFSHTYAAARRRRLHVRAQLRLRRLRLRQLARQLRQHRRAGAAARDHLRPHRGLRRRRCPAVHGHAGRYVRAERRRATTASRRAAALSVDAIDLGLGRGLETGSHLELSATRPRRRDRRRVLRRLRHRRLQVRRARRGRTARRDRAHEPARRLGDRRCRREDARGRHRRTRCP